MAHFYGTLKGARGEASRLGHKSSGLRTGAASWEGAVSVHLYHDETAGQDMAEVQLIPWHGAGVYRSLYRGPVSGAPVKPADEPHIVRALHNLVAHVVGNRGHRGGNPYCIPEVKEALRLLAEYRGVKDYLDAADKKFDVVELEERDCMRCEETFEDDGTHDVCPKCRQNINRTDMGEPDTLKARRSASDARQVLAGLRDSYLRLSEHERNVVRNVVLQQCDRAATEEPETLKARRKAPVLRQSPGVAGSDAARRGSSENEQPPKSHLEQLAADVDRYESGDMDEGDEVAMFQRMIDDGVVWHFQGSYGRQAMALIEAGRCMLGPHGCRDYYGNYVPSRTEVQPGTKGSPEYVAAHCDA